MKQLGFWTGIFGSALLAALTGCGGDKDEGLGAAGSGGSTGSGGSGMSGAGGTGPAACSTPLQVLFNPAYSAYDGQNTYKVPIIAIGATGDVKWSASDPAMVDIDPGAVDLGDSGALVGKAAMVTTRKAGKVTITATAGTECGSGELTITQATPDLRKLGSDRYNNGIPVTFDGGTTPACSNCHGATSNTQLLDVQHTPQQTGGYTDDDLVGIVTRGQKPAGVGCRVIACSTWNTFHKWTVTPDEAQGIVFYLRSLEPAPQGAIDFRPPGRPADGGGTGG